VVAKYRAPHRNLECWRDLYSAWEK